MDLLIHKNLLNLVLYNKIWVFCFVPCRYKCPGSWSTRAYPFYKRSYWSQSLRNIKIPTLPGITTFWAPLFRHSVSFAISIYLRLSQFESSTYGKHQKRQTIFTEFKSSNYSTCASYVLKRRRYCLFFLLLISIKSWIRFIQKRTQFNIWKPCLSASNRRSNIYIWVCFRCNNTTNKCFSQGKCVTSLLSFICIVYTPHSREIKIDSNRNKKLIAVILLSLNIQLRIEVLRCYAYWMMLFGETCIGASCKEAVWCIWTVALHAGHS